MPVTYHIKYFHISCSNYLTINCKKVFGELCLLKKKKSWFSPILNIMRSVEFFFVYPLLGSTLFFAVYCPFYTKLNASQIQLETAQIMNIRIRWDCSLPASAFWEKKTFCRNSVRQSNSAQLGTKSLRAANRSVKPLWRCW